MSGESGKTTVRSVERALDILLCFTDESNLAMSEIALRVNLHKSTVHRLLASLENKGFVIRDPSTEKYRLGFRIWELSANLSQSDDPAILLYPEMELLRDELGETVSLYVRDGHERIRIQAVQSNLAIRRVAPVGARLPLYVGASSKILIAFSSEEEQNEILTASNWPDSIDQLQFREQLKSILHHGYATSIEEREPGAAAVATPVFRRSGELVAALSVSGPANRLTERKMQQYVDRVKESAYRMGKMIP